MMHLDNFYKFTENITDEGAYREFDPDSSAGTSK